MILRKGILECGRFVVPYRCYGDRGPTILCVGGAQQSMAIWRRTVSRFSATHRSVTMDLPGQGRAIRKSGPHQITLDEQIGVLHAVVQASQPHQALAVVGASWGGILAAAYAAAYVDSVDKLILASFGLRTTPRLLRLIEDGRRLYLTGQKERLGNLIVDCFGQQVSSGYKDLICRQFREMGPEQLLSLKAHCEMFERSAELTALVDFRRIRARTLLINGAQDAILDLSDMPVVAGLIPDCRTKCVDGVGHFLHFEDERVLEFFAEFLCGEERSPA